MIIVMTAVSMVLIGMTAVWFTPLRPVLLRCLSGVNRLRFTCKVQLLIDESRSVSEDKVFCVQMIGKIPTPRDRMDTNVCVELMDITNSRFQPDPVLSVDECYRSSGQADFHFVTHNGIIPKKNAVIIPWKTIVRIPAHQLRFARRGRRKLLFKVSILACENGEVLTSDQQAIEYVFCRDGYQELGERKMDVLKASIELAAKWGVEESSFNNETKQTFLQWLNQEAQTFPAAMQLTEWVETLQTHHFCNDRQAVDCLLAYAEQTDKLAAIELALRVFASNAVMTTEQFAGLSDVVRRLQIKKDRFLALCQKILLFSECRLQAPALLFGIDESMDEDTFRIRLNEEYRKWNARVTHPDEEIRRQADKMLSLIAELRSSRIPSGVS
ncbi:MAG: hypothetical protein ISS71_05570 [Phycisphaerae bacterium]|nr:hypothetical protein [Phycisphaerae bacterium]